MLVSPVRRAVRAGLAAMALFLAACGGGDGGGGDPTGPDDASNRAVGSITLIAGGNQNVGPATIVPSAPTVQVKSDRGNPLRGATVVLSVENGRGTLDASSVTTDASGNASFPRWVAPLTVGEFAVNAVASGPAGGSASVRVTASVVDAAQQSVTQTVGAGGGTISIPSAVPPLGGLQIQVPPGSFSRSTTFSIQYGPAPLLPAHLTLASPLIGISAGTTPSDSIIDIRIPVTGTLGTGQVIRAFAVAADNGLIPIPTKSSTESSITIGITDFTSAAAALHWTARVVYPGGAAPSVLSNFGIRILTAFWTPPATGTFGVGFAVGRDNMGFVNYGSVGAAGGFCAGSTVAAGGWFRKKSDAVLLTARAQYPSLLSDAETGGWWMTSQLNPAVRLATELQKRYGPIANTIGNWRYDRLAQNDRTVWVNALYQLVNGTQPVFLAIFDAGLTAGHAILAHRVDAGNGRLFVSDPNYPETEREMQWNAASATWSPFMASSNRGTPNNTPYVLFADASYLFWEQRSYIAGVIDSYNANRLVGQFPNATGVVRRKDGSEVSIDNPVTAFDVQARDNDLVFRFTSIGSGAAHVINATNRSGTAAPTAIPNNTTDLTVPLEFGENKIGVVLEQTTSPGKTSWRDAKLFVVNRARPRISFLQQPANGKENESFSIKVGLVDEVGTPVPGVYSLFLTLQGGAAGAVLTGGGAFNTLADGTATLSISVSKAGTGYTLQVSGANLTPVTSSAFDIEAAGAFTGRVVHAVSGQGLGGVSIVVGDIFGDHATTSLPNGDWTVTGVGGGTFDITATMTGFVSTTLFNQVLTPPSTVVEPIPLVPDAGPGGVFGQIRNAVNAQLITSLTTVEARAGMNASTGPVAFSQNTTTGSYALPNLPAGVYTLTATNPAYHSTSRTGVVVGGGPATQGPDLVMNPLGGGVARVVLTWGATPSDLDSHMTGPTTGGARFWRYYASPGNCQVAPFVCLDVDDVSGHGPETMTIGQLTPGVYRYYVYDFSNRTNNASTALGSSGAKVQLFIGGQVHNFFVPSGTGNAWAVFTWDGTTVTPLNQLYTINGTPQPARLLGLSFPDAVQADLRRLLDLPPKR